MQETRAEKSESGVMAAKRTERAGGGALAEDKTTRAAKRTERAGGGEVRVGSGTAR